jgi:tetratricopeptide (TPR) repeat protein
MDGRWKLALAGGFLSGLIGCASTPKHEPFPLPPPPTSTASKSIFVPEPPDEGPVKDGPLAASTMLVFANVWLEAITQDPNKPAAEREQLVAQARKAYQDILQKDPKCVDALLGLGQLYQVTGEADKLRQVEERAKATHATNPKVWAWLAVRRAQAKEFDTAAECYYEAAKLDPENRLYRIHLGLTLARSGRYDEGREWLMRTMREAEARYNLAKMMLHNNEPEKARIELRMALQVDPAMQAAKDQLLSLTVSAAGDVRTVGHEERQ